MMMAGLSPGAVSDRRRVDVDRGGAAFFRSRISDAFSDAPRLTGARLSR
jgi:hypothetical protein